MSDLHQTKCVACRAGEPTVTEDEIKTLHPQIPEWQVKEVDGIKRLERVFKFRTFDRAIKFIDHVARVAEKENHHPRIVVEGANVTLHWWTHKVKGLHMNDFIMAAKMDKLSKLYL